MDVKQNPFSLYDFLGYFTPGAIFLYGVIAVYAHAASDLTPTEYVSNVLSFEKRPEIYIPFVLVAYTIGHIMSFLSSITIERFSIWRYGYPSKYLLGFKPRGFFHTKEKKALRIVLRCFTAAFLFPITVLDLVLGSLCGFRDLYAKTLDPLLIAVLKKKMSILLIRHSGIKKLSDYGDTSDLDFFRYGSHFALENAPNHLAKMHNYVALYGFLRTLTLITIAAFWGIAWHAYSGTFTPTFSVCAIGTTALVAYVLYMAFVKFYRRFSLEVLMAVAVSITRGKPN